MRQPAGNQLCRANDQRPLRDKGKARILRTWKLSQTATTDFREHPSALFAPMFFIGAGNGLVPPSGIAGAVSVKPDLAGAAAGLTGSLQIGFGAVVAPLIGAALRATGWPPVTIMLRCSLLAIDALGLVAGQPRSAAE